MSCLDGCEAGCLAAVLATVVWLVGWLLVDNWYSSSSLFLLMAVWSCCLITRIWPSSSANSWTRGFRPGPAPRPGPQSPRPRHWTGATPFPETAVNRPRLEPEPRHRPRRPLALVSRDRCFPRQGRELVLARVEGCGPGGSS